jgi:hypothetical protein
MKSNIDNKDNKQRGIYQKEDHGEELKRVSLALISVKSAVDSALRAFLLLRDFL